MKNLFYMFIAVAVIGGISSCKNRTAHASASEAARHYTEHSYRTGNYDRFVDGIHFEKQTPKKVVKEEKKAYARTLKNNNDPEVRRRGGLKESRVTGERVAKDGNNAEVMLRNYYNDGSMEDIRYDMIRDRNQWKVKVGNDKEVWKTTTADGRDIVVKLKDNDYKSFVKIKEDGEKTFVKDIDPENSDREVIKTLDDGDREKKRIH